MNFDITSHLCRHQSLTHYITAELPAFSTRSATFAGCPHAAKRSRTLALKACLLLAPAFCFTLVVLPLAFCVQLFLATVHALLECIYACLFRRKRCNRFDEFFGDFFYSHHLFTQPLFMHQHGFSLAQCSLAKIVLFHKPYPHPPKITRQNPLAI